jgi:positive regulator of sigma E activity
MKPSVPETGTVIRLEGDEAVVMFKGGKSCKGCGAAKIGLCRSGNTSMFLTAGNALGAEVGDTVQVDLDRQIKRKGFVLAYGIPLFSLIAGAVAGHIMGDYLSVPSLDVVAGFISLSLVSLISFRRLKHLDKSNRMVVKRVISDYLFSGEVKSEEESRYMRYSGH